VPHPQVRSCFLLCPFSPVALGTGAIDPTATKITLPFGRVYDLVNQVHEADPSFLPLGCCVMEGLQIATR